MFTKKPKFQILTAYPIELGYVCVEVLYPFDGATRTLYCRDARAIVRNLGKLGLETVNRILYPEE